MDVTLATTTRLTGRLTLPSDKAICQRVVLAAAVAEGTTSIRPWSSAEDCQRAVAVIEGLGVAVRRTGAELLIEGRGPAGLRASATALPCGASGTTMRLSAGLLAGQAFTTRLEAEGSLRTRPMRRIVEPLRMMGAAIEGASAASDEEDVYPPLVIHGARPLRSIRYDMPVKSAQVKSAVLLAGLAAREGVTVVELVPTRDHTERLLRRCGIHIEVRGREIHLQPGELAAPGDIVVPGDISSAAFFVVAAVCTLGSQVTIESVGLNPTRTGFLRVLERMGARLTVTRREETWEPVGVIAVEAGPLQATTVTADDVPALIDELPILMVAAACADGVSRFEGVGELRLKETDRIASMAAGLSSMGIHVERPDDETIVIEGGRLRGARVQSRGDHRTAMSLAVAGLIAEGQTVLGGVECIAKSFPEFFDSLAAIGGPPTVKSR